MNETTLNPYLKTLYESIFHQKTQQRCTVNRPEKIAVPVYMKFFTGLSFSFFACIHNKLLVITDLTTEQFQNLNVETHAYVLVTMRNRAMLDFILAKKGGVCSLIGDQCCISFQELM